MYSDSTNARWRGPSDQKVVEAFAAESADPALRVRVRSRCPRRCADDPDLSVGEHGVEVRGELAVAVTDEESELGGAVAEIHQQVPGLLGDPSSGGVDGDTGDVHAAGGVFDQDKDVEAAEEDGVDVGEVDGEDGVGLRGEKLFPGRSRP